MQEIARTATIDPLVHVTDFAKDALSFGTESGMATSTGRPKTKLTPSESPVTAMVESTVVSVEASVVVFVVVSQCPPVEHV